MHGLDLLLVSLMLGLEFAHFVLIGFIVRLNCRLHVVRLFLIVFHGVVFSSKTLQFLIKGAYLGS
jgi:hypothetical protein